MSLDQNLAKQLRKDEGYSRTAYKDSLGYWTIGIGTLIDPHKGEGLYDEEIQFIFQNRMNKKKNELLARLPWVATLSEARQGVLLNMAFQMGVQGVCGFVTTLDLIRKGQYQEAGEQMKKSRWYSQTPNRAARLIKQMQTDRWVFEGE